MRGIRLRPLSCYAERKAKGDDGILIGHVSQVCALDLASQRLLRRSFWKPFDYLWFTNGISFAPLESLF